MNRKFLSQNLAIVLSELCVVDFFRRSYLVEFAHEHLGHGYRHCSVWCSRIAVNLDSKYKRLTSALHWHVPYPLPHLDPQGSLLLPYYPRLLPRPRMAQGFLLQCSPAVGPRAAQPLSSASSVSPRHSGRGYSLAAEKKIQI
jgi:hypothetical protein